MPTTRSATRSARGPNSKQATHNQNLDISRNTSANKNQSKQSPRVKSDTVESDPPKKKSKTSNSTENDQHVNGAKQDERTIVINRSPVLQLWGAVVAQFLYPDLSWKACVAVGDSISALCAISKGRSIGVIDTKDDADSEEKKPSKQEANSQLVVMGFPIDLRDDAVMVKGKLKTSNEHALKHNYGDEDQYAKVKQAMETALDGWKDSKDELDKKAFHMYEKFRPTVAKGQQGWGRKGELSLDKISEVVGC